APLLALAQCLVEDVAREGVDQARLLGDGKELGGSEQAARRVPPADERLDARDGVRREVELRLVVEREVSARERLAQLGKEGQPRAPVLVTARRVELPAGLRRLRRVQRHVRLL